MENNRFVMQKTVDLSLLNDGMNIPVSACALLKAWDKSILTHGAGKVLIDGEFYDAKLKSHKDVIQIHYGRQPALAMKLRAIFKKSYEFLKKNSDEQGVVGATFMDGKYEEIKDEIGSLA